MLRNCQLVTRVCAQLQTTRQTEKHSRESRLDLGRDLPLSFGAAVTQIVVDQYILVHVLYSIYDYVLYVVSRN